MLSIAPLFILLIALHAVAAASGSFRGAGNHGGDRRLSLSGTRVVRIESRFRQLSAASADNDNSNVYATGTPGDNAQQWVLVPSTKTNCNDDCFQLVHRGRNEKVVIGDIQGGFRTSPFDGTKIDMRTANVRLEPNSDAIGGDTWSFRSVATNSNNNVVELYNEESGFCLRDNFEGVGSKVIAPRPDAGCIKWTPVTIDVPELSAAMVTIRNVETRRFLETSTYSARAGSGSVSSAERFRLERVNDDDGLSYNVVGGYGYVGFNELDQIYSAPEDGNPSSLQPLEAYGDNLHWRLQEQDCPDYAHPLSTCVRMIAANNNRVLADGVDDEQLGFTDRTVLQSPRNGAPNQLWEITPLR